MWTVGADGVMVARSSRCVSLHVHLETTSSAADLARIVREAVVRGAPLRSIDVGGFLLSGDPAELVAAIATASSLQSLVLDGLGLDSWGLLGPVVVRLERVSLSRNHPQLASAALGPMLRHCRVVSMEDAGMSVTELGPAVASLGYDGCRFSQVQSLNLSGNRDLGDEGLRSLMSVEWRCLRHLRLASCGLTRASMDTLAHGASSATVAGLELLDLSSNALADEGVSVLASCLGSKLLTLRLESVEMGPSGAEALARTLTALPRLTCLSVASNRVSDAGGLAIAQALASHRNLSCLSLERTTIRAGTGVSLARAIAQSRSLQRVALRGTWMGFAAVDSIIGAALTRPTHRPVAVTGLDSLDLDRLGDQLQLVEARTRRLRLRIRLWRACR